MSARVLYVITDSGVGGAEKILADLLKNLNRDRFSPVAVVVLKEKRESAARWEQSGVRVVSLGMGKWPSDRVFHELRKIVQDVKPDLVHAFLYHSVQLVRFLHRTEPSFKLISSPRINYRFAPMWAQWGDRWLKKQDDLAVAESTATAQFLISTLNYSPDKVMTIFNGVDQRTYRFDLESRRRLRREWGVGESDMMIGAVGRLHEQKGFDVLIEALAKMKKNHFLTRAFIFGDGREKRRLERLITKRSVPLRIVPTRLDMPAVYSSFDIFVQSSRYEGMPNALLEAMSSGCAAVATAVDGTLDILRDGENGILVKPNDPASLARALDALSLNAPLRRILASNALQTIERFSIEQMVLSFEEAYQKVMG